MDKTDSPPQTQESQTKEFIALVLVQLMFGSFPLTGQKALLGLSPLSLMTVRVSAAAIVFTLYATPRRMFEVPLSDRFKLAGCSALGVFLNQWLFLEGLSRTTALNAAILCTAIPLWTLLLAAMCGQERLRAQKVLGIIFAVAGAIYLLRVDRFEWSRGHGLGNGLIILNCLLYSSYLVIMRGVLKRVPTPVALAWVFAWASLGALALGLGELSDAVETASTSAWLWTAYVVAIPTIGSYFVVTWVQGRVKASTVGVFVTLQPIVAAALDWMVYGRLPDQRALVSASGILLGVWLASRSPRKLGSRVKTES